jgi:hypothetical protein
MILISVNIACRYDMSINDLFNGNGVIGNSAKFGLDVCITETTARTVLSLRCVVHVTAHSVAQIIDSDVLISLNIEWEMICK